MFVLLNSSMLFFSSPTFLAERWFMLVICCCLSAKNILLVSYVQYRFIFFSSGQCFAACSVSFLVIVDQVFYLFCGSFQSLG